jgi:glutamine synthetase
MTALNLIVADQLNAFHTAVEKEIAKGAEKRLAVVGVLRKYIKDSKNVRFEGDGYSDAWVKEAEKRGLSNVKNTPRAIEAYLTPESIILFERNAVLSKVELEARQEIKLENYIKKVQIEARVMGDLALNHIVPTAIAYQNKLITNANGLKGLGVDNKSVVKTIQEISVHIDTITDTVRKMTDERKRLNKITETHKRAYGYCDDVKEKYFEKIRDAVDKLELLVDDEDWPLVKYRELLFLR